jgi:hypothetical protein
VINQMGYFWPHMANTQFGGKAGCAGLNRLLDFVGAMLSALPLAIRAGVSLRFGRRDSLALFLQNAGYFLTDNRDKAIKRGLIQSGHNSL